MSDWIVRLVEQSGYLGIGFLMFLETVFPPIPSEVIMPLAGMQAGRGTLSLPAVIASGAGGAMLGNMVWYLLARALGMERFRPFIARWGRWLTLDWTEIEKADAYFRRHDALFVGMGRMVPTVRSLVSIPAGFSHMSLKRVLIWSTLGTVGWTTALAFGGYLLGTQYAAVETYVGPVSNAIVIGLVLLYVYRVITWKPSTSRS